jgi:long-subunit acyl-CoA synthetase (AMP-forming)
MSVIESEPARAQPAAMGAATLCEAFQITAAERPDQVALRTPGGTLEITYGEYAQRVERLAGGFAALGLGRGDTMALMLTNRPEFNLLDTAAFHLGATPFSIYNTSAPEQVEHLLQNAGSRIAVTERALLPSLAAGAERYGGIEQIVVIDGEDDGDVIGLTDLESLEPSDFHFEQSWRAVEPSDVLTLIYTSGTTGPPKGVQLTHANLMAEIRGVHGLLPAEPGGRLTSFLPSAHIADRWASHYQGSICHGFTITSIPDPRTIIEHLPEVRPTTWGSVPRIWEKLKAGLEAKGITDPGSLPEEARAQVIASLGLDECEWTVVGAAPTPVEVLEYFGALGLPICELWGMSELSCCVTINPPDRIKLGTCGVALEGAELVLADDGEVLVRGPILMLGYRGEPEKTAEAIDADGWMHTGDIGKIDDDGYLSIVDRKKELIINAAGKNMSPANIEARLKGSGALIGQACCIGDGRPYNVALLVLDPDACAAYASKAGLDDASAAALAEDEGVKEAVAAGVEEANSHLSRVEQVKRFRILPVDWLPDSEELTPTMKLKRREIHRKYRVEIEDLYSG